jgi:hypothetical protein
LIRQKPPDLICRLVPHGRDPVIGVLESEPWSQQAHAGYVQIPPTHGLQDRGMPPRRASGRDSLVGNRFREMKHPDTVRKHRRAPLAQIQAPGVHLAEMLEQLGLEYVAAPDQGVQTRQELIVGKTCERRCHDMTSSGPMG